jgi:beta-lactamase class A
MSDTLPNLADIDERIAAASENLRELIEQAAAYSGAADEDLMSQRITEQEAVLERLTRQRDELSQTKAQTGPREMK